MPNKIDRDALNPELENSPSKMSKMNFLRLFNRKRGVEECQKLRGKAQEKAQDLKDKLEEKLAAIQDLLISRFFHAFC